MRRSESMKLLLFFSCCLVSIREWVRCCWPEWSGAEQAMVDNFEKKKESTLWSQVITNDIACRFASSEAREAKAEPCCDLKRLSRVSQFFGLCLCYSWRETSSSAAVANSQQPADRGCLCNVSEGNKKEEMMRERRKRRIRNRGVKQML